MSNLHLHDGECPGAGGVPRPPSSSRVSFMRHWILLLSVILVPAALGAAPPPRPPNIVLLLCDNLGYGDIEVYNPQAKQPTPRLNQLAREGTVFTHAYAASPVCTPSRAALLTGCYPRRIGLDRTPASPGHVLVPVSPYGLHPDEVTIAEALRPQGYRSICIGKWHLGDQPSFLPTRQGFDEFFGIPYSDNMVGTTDGRHPPLPLMNGEAVIDAPVDVNTLSRRCTERALRFITENRDRPFFLYFPQITPGSTARPPAHPDFQGKSRNGPWGDSVLELDWSTGRILDTLEELALTRDTLILWTNDNGAPGQAQRGGSNAPLKGEAYSVSEGGMRVPLLARWPGRVPAGARNSELVTLMDMLPTLAALAGHRLAATRPIDGHDIRPLLSGARGARSPYDAFFYYYLDQVQAVRSGPWKLYVGGEGRLVGFGARTVTTQPALYHLADDPQETANVHDRHPEILARFEQHLARIRADLGELDRRGPGCRPIGQVAAPTPRLLPPAQP
ncbi:MAG: sulfatase [Verrucomicrobia bacterium]|nr:sulfatase [Verrucomicrobiota bacterium]